MGWDGLTKRTYEACVRACVFVFVLFFLSSFYAVHFFFCLSRFSFFLSRLYLTPTVGMRSFAHDQLCSCLFVFCQTNEKYKITEKNTERSARQGGDRDGGVRRSLAGNGGAGGVLLQREDHAAHRGHPHVPPTPAKVRGEGKGKGRSQATRGKVGVYTRYIY